MSLYSSDSESETEFSNPSIILQKAIHDCMNMEPEATASVVSVKQRLSSIKKKLVKNSPTETPNTRKNTQKFNKLDSVQKDIHSDFEKLMKKVDTMFELIGNVFGEVESLECRVAEIESKPNALEEVKSLESRIAQLESKQSVTYSQVTSMIPPVNNLKSVANEDRIDKLEFSGSEDERKKRLLHVILTHPTIDKDNTDSNKIKVMMTNILKMEQREIYENLVVLKGPREHSVILKFSDKRFKLFFFKAKKALRPGNSDVSVSSDNIYANDYLTRYNFKILMTLKKLKKENSLENPWPFKSLYSFEGKVYVKQGTGNEAENSVHVKYPSMIDKILQTARQGTSVTREVDARNP